MFPFSEDKPSYGHLAADPDNSTICGDWANKVKEQQVEKAQSAPELMEAQRTNEEDGGGQREEEEDSRLVHEEAGGGCKQAGVALKFHGEAKKRES